MSTSSNLEPQAFGHILIKTTFGDLELELFTRQCPKLTRNFVQLCLDGYYQGTIFDRVEKDFIAVGGVRRNINQSRKDDLKDYLQHYKDEFHSRLRFTRRGLLATANTEKDANGPEFFLTLGSTPELQNKHSIIGRLKGNSVYCLVDLNECQVDDNLTPLSDKSILDVQVIDNPFASELKPRPELLKILENKPTKEEKSDNDQRTQSGLQKPNKKLSFYHEDSSEEDEQEDDKPIDSGIVASNESSQRSIEIEEEAIPNRDGSNQNPSDVDKKVSKNSREERLREVREQFQNLKKQFECASATKIRTLSERRGVKRTGDHGPGEGQSAESSVSNSIEREPGCREHETIIMVQSFRKKLKEISRKPTNETRNHTQVKTSRKSRESDTDDSQRLQQELDMVDGDDWLCHKFEARESDEEDDSLTTIDSNRQ